MDKKQFSQRLSALRIEKDISARDMSLSLGQSASYINNIENGVNLPSMQAFFDICDFLEITPYEFFDTSLSSPSKLKLLCQSAKSLSSRQLELMIAFIDELSVTTKPDRP